MTIQLSVTVWTILCFLALYWILRKLLFEPILAVMDQRRKKIDDAKNAKQEARRQLEEQRKNALAQQEEARLKAKQEADAEADSIRLEGKQLLENAKKERIATIDAFRAQMDEEYARDLEAAEGSLSDIADRFLTRLLTREP